VLRVSSPSSFQAMGRVGSGGMVIWCLSDKAGLGWVLDLELLASLAIWKRECWSSCSITVC